MSVVLVAIGGVAGVLARYGITRATLHTDALISGRRWRSTWSARSSTFSAQIVLEVDGGRPGTAAAYLVASVAGGIAAATAGYALGRAVT
jgi:fluoride ion exporter CrcB/FEX